MAADQQLLAQLLVLAGLLAGTGEYSVMVRRRAERRAAVAAAHASGLQGLVRVFLADPRP